jgi:hypothetical protein
VRGWTWGCACVEGTALQRVLRLDCAQPLKCVKPATADGVQGRARVQEPREGGRSPQGCRSGTCRPQGDTMRCTLHGKCVCRNFWQHHQNNPLCGRNKILSSICPQVGGAPMASRHCNASSAPTKPNFLLAPCQHSCKIADLWLHFAEETQIAAP